MNAITLLCLFAAGASAQYGQSSSSYGSSYGTTSRHVPILRYNQNIVGGQSDSHDFESGNGIRQSESTQVVAGHGGSYDDGYGQMVRSTSSIVKSGSVQYTSPEGLPITLSYTADENGFHPQGNHLPVAPAMPKELVDAYSSAARTTGGYAAPAVRVADSYSAPLRVNTYSAPQEIRMNYAPVAVRSTY